MKNSKRIIKLVILITAVFISYFIFSDWQNFKAGFMGEPPIENSNKR